MRHIRKKSNQRPTKEGIKLLKNSRRGVLCLNGDGGYPYGLPINYIFDEENSKIYFHGSRAGHKIDSIKKSPKASFVVVGPEEIIKEDWAPYLTSVILFGKVSLIDNEDRALRALKALGLKYYPSEDLVDETIEKDLKTVQVLCFDIEHMSVKRVQER